MNPTTDAERKVSLTTRRLALTNADGKLVRVFSVADESTYVVLRYDTGRLELTSNLKELEDEKVEFELVTKFTAQDLSRKPLSLGQFGELKATEEIKDVLLDDNLPKESHQFEWVSGGLISIVALLLLWVGERNAPPPPPPEVEAVRTVKVIQRPKPPEARNVNKQVNLSAQRTTTPPKMRTNVGSVGALGVLGSLSKGKTVGGLDLGAMKTTAGPGLGGTGGSGGVQTSLYAKGLVGAPLGPGANAQGGGGYGTVGKGGGQAGYGTHSLVGSGGGGPITLGTDASVEGGLDRDAIADVIMRNIGQIRFCYEQGLKGNPGLEGRVSAKFTIGGDGFIKEAGVANTTLNSNLVEDCMMMRLKSWKFPKPKNGVDVKIVYPFVLRKVGRG